MIPDGSEVLLRPAVAEDDEFLRDLFVDVRRDEFESAGFPAEQLKPLLAMQYVAQKRGSLSTSGSFGATLQFWSAAFEPARPWGPYSNDVDVETNG